MPIVAVTAYAFNEKIREVFKAGMNAYLPKPIPNDKLKEIL